MNYLKDNKSSLVCLQETWMCSGDKALYQVMHEYGYNVVKRERVTKGGGGLAILFVTELQVKRTVVCARDKYKTFEHTSCKLLINNKNINFINLYRPPYSQKHQFTVKMFIDEFELFLYDLFECCTNVILCGDFNIDLNLISNTLTIRFLNLLKMFKLIQLTNKPTHKKGGLLDLVIINENLQEEICSTEVDTIFQTDHYPVIANIKCNGIEKDSVVIKTVRELHNMNTEIFKKDLENESISNPSFIRDLSIPDAIDLYNDTLKKLLTKQCPLVTKRYRKRRNKSKWYNANLQRLKQKKRQAERRFRKHPNDENRSNFVLIKNKYNHEMKEARTKFYHNNIQKNLSNSRNLYAVLRKVTGCCKEKCIPTGRSKKVIADEMANFYSEKISKIREEVQTSSASQEYSRNTISSQNLRIFEKFSQVNESELRKCISEIKSKTCKADPIPTSLVKENLDILMPILLHIINSCIQQRIFPDQLKNGLVTPIIKDNRKCTDDFQNFRPVCNLTFLSKLLERVMYSQLNKFVLENNLHAVHQSSYRADHSCETALINIVDDIQNMKKDKRFVALILLDMSARVRHG